MAVKFKFRTAELRAPVQPSLSQARGRVGQRALPSGACRASERRVKLRHQGRHGRALGLG